MATYTNRASFSSRPNFKLDIEVTVSGTTATMRAYAVRTGTETTTPFANSGGGATRGYSFTNSNTPTSGSAEWVFDFRPATSSSSTNPYSVDVWASGVTRTLSATSTITATASMSLLGSASVSVTVPIVTTPSPVISGSFANGTVGTFYSSSITASNSPTSWSSSGSIPPGLSTSFSGGTFTLSGTPTTAGSYTFSVTALNAGGSDTKSFTVVISQPAPVISGFFANGTLAVGYTSAISASNNPTNWSISGSLPPGLGRQSGEGPGGSNYTLTGTPTAAGTYTFTISASNGGGTDSQSRSITIAAPTNPSWDSTAAFPSGKVGTAYNASRTASNATSITSPSTNAPGLSAFASGTSTLVLSGTPTSAGTFNVSATANGAAGTSPTTLNTTVTIAPLAPPTWSDTSLSNDFRVGQSFATTSGGNNSLSATNSAGFSIISGSIPSGVSAARSLSGSTAFYTFTGTPTTRGPYSFAVRASNSDGIASPDLTFSGTVTHPPLWTDETLANFNQGRVYSDALSVSTSTAVTWTVSAGSLPAGITTTTSGSNTNTLNFTGTPTGTGSFSFTITASNSDGFLSKSFSGNILLPPNWIKNELSSFIEGNVYSDSVSATNNPTYSLTGTLPTGITHLNGALTGTPTTVNQAFNFTITATNDDGFVSQAFSGTVQPDLGGGIKVFDGATWGNKEIYAYDGAEWVLGRVHRYNGSIWVKSLF